MYLSPLSSDDYRLLSYDFSNIKDAFFFNLQYANGRILGNFLGYVIANSVFLKVFVKAFVITAVIFMIPTVMNIKKSWACFVSFIFLLALDPISEAISFAYIISDGLFRETMWLGHTIASKQVATALVGAIVFINICVVLIRVYGKRG